jgi:hypothetical protein
MRQTGDTDKLSNIKLKAEIQKEHPQRHTQSEYEKFYNTNKAVQYVYIFNIKA